MTGARVGARGVGGNPHADSRAPEAAHALNEGLAEVVEQARRSLVRIEVGRGRARGYGSGTVWTADGLVITNAHVVAGALGGRRGGGRRGNRRGPRSRRGGGKAARWGRRGNRGPVAAEVGHRAPVRFVEPDDDRRRLRLRLPDGRSSEATVLAFDPKSDLAALQLETSSGELQPIVPGDAHALLPGSLVVAVGHPWGVDGAATAGAVIGLDEGFGDLRSPGREWLAVGARLRPGHSGGPMLDAHSRLVGINTIMNGHGVGVAIPVHVVQDFLERAIVDVRAA